MSYDPADRIIISQEDPNNNDVEVGMLGTVLRFSGGVTYTVLLDLHNNTRQIPSDKFMKYHGGGNGVDHIYLSSDGSGLDNG